MQKDVVYIDVEDDITAIIGKVKASKEKIVALVPPKRIGVLQSAVNLRLLNRAASGSHKHLVLITNNQALMALSASAKIPVAKNLQSKPEIAEIPALSVDDDDDIIDGENLPVGELARTVESPKSDTTLDGIDIDDDTPKATPPMAGSHPAKPRVKSGIKVPSFDSFRKKVFIIGGLGVFLLGFLIWAIFFAGSATVIIDARTSETDVNIAAAIGPELTTDAEASTLKSVAVQDKQSQSVDFAATGTEDKGEKATGTVKFSTDSISIAVQGATIPAGTVLTSSGGQTFLTAQSVTINLSTYSGASTGVIASAAGPQYNGANGTVSGAPSGITAQLTGATSGGTERIVKIVTQADVAKAKAQLVAQKTDDFKQKLQEKFKDDVIVIEDSFQSTPADPDSTPSIGQEAPDGKAKLTSEVAYTMSGVSKADLSAYLKSALEKQLNGDEQRVYSDGGKTAKLSGFKQNNGNTTVTVVAKGKIGPKINDNEIKETVKGKRFGEIQSELKQIEGVNDVEVKFSPFWVGTVPEDTKKIKIEFKLQNDS